MALQRKNTQTCPMVEFYTYCFMNKQYVKGLQKGKRHTWLVWALLFPVSIQRQWLHCSKNWSKKRSRMGQKEVDNGSKMRSTSTGRIEVDNESKRGQAWVKKKSSLGQKEVDKCIPTVRIIHILFHEQAVCRRASKWKKANLTRVGNIAM